VTATGPLARLMALLAPDAIRVSTSTDDSARIVAVGWATVELERATAELAAALGIAPVRFAPAPESSVLGARCLVGAGVLPGGLSLAILEPATEGRLAATLARFGEGPAAAWVAWPPIGVSVNAPGAPTGDRAASDLEALNFSAAGAGPFGPERLVPGGPAQGPHRLRIEPAGTIRA
jgi:hypothetical protein